MGIGTWQLVIYFYPDPFIRPILRWVWAELACNRGVDWVETDSAEQADITLDGSRLPLAENFYRDVEAGLFQHRHHFTDRPLILTDEGRPDLFATAFYMLNCLQEYSASGEDLDSYGRFRYEASWQHRFGLIEENVVQGLFDGVAAELKLPTSFGLGMQPSQVHLSHDMDLVNNGWIQDGKWALRHGQPWLTAAYMIRQAMGRPHWGDVDGIMDLHERYGLISTFFWIPIEGRDGLDGIRNADYRANSPQIQKRMDRIEARGFGNGIHKAADARPLKEQLPLLGRPVSANRNHYLRFDLPNHFDEVEAAGLSLDCSLGFAEHIGFRTGYGLPFKPYSLEEQRPYGFTVQPLHIMDVTLHQYMGLAPARMAERMIDFLDKHRRGAVVSLLWHNNYLLSSGAYRQYRPVYEEVLQWLQRERWISCTHNL